MSRPDTRADESVTALTDLALAVRAAVEEREPKRLGELFAPAALVCVSGRFLATEEALRRLSTFFRQIDQVSMELTRVEEQEVTDDSAFGSFAVNFHWTDTNAWEERDASGVMSLTARQTPSAKTDTVARTRPWRITGFAYTPRTNEPADEQLTQGVSPSGWATNLIDAAYGPLSIWR